jgi:NAD(P)-dependent dehydrogenase (short-subunit alcohol dehydrogenase family)
MTARPVAITGANSGVGFEASRQLAALGVPVVLICRSEARGHEAMARIIDETPEAQLTLELCDLGDLSQVRALADRLRDSARGWGALVNNAGLYRARLEQTDDGLERTLAVNHLGHYLLTRLLEDELRAAGARIVNVSSQGHTRGQLRRRPLDEILTGPADYNGIQAYCDSKLCNVLFMRELVRRWGNDITSTAVHPGVLATAIWDRERTLLMGFIRRFAKPFMDSPETGGQAVSTLAADPAHAGTTDAYFRRLQSARPASMADDRDLAEELWQVSERLVGL